MYCQKCGTKLTENVKFCKECGFGVSDISDEKLPASSLRRLANFFIDRILGGIVFLIFIVAIWGLVSVISNTYSLQDNTFIKIFNIIIPLLIALSFYFNPLYYLFFEAIWGKTIGKWITKTKVVRRDGSKPKFIQILGRSFARLIPFEAFSFLFSNNPVGWHDSLSKTLVVPADYTPDDVKKIDFDKAKKQKTNKVIVIVAIIGGLLIFISIIGILASVVLASLNSARAKGDDALIKSNLSSARAEAEIFYSGNNSYSGVCNDTEMVKLLSEASKSGTDSETNYICNDNNSSWAASTPLKSDGYWCADTLGQSIKIDTPLDTQTSCSPIMGATPILNGTNTSSAGQTNIGYEFKLAGGEYIHSCAYITCQVILYGTLDATAKILDEQNGWYKVQVTEYGYFNINNSPTYVSRLTTPVITIGWIRGDLVPNSPK